VPVTVMVKVPTGVAEEVPIVNVELPEPPPIDAGLKLAVAPAGKPLALRFTVSAKPLEELIAMVELPLLPRRTASEFGEAEMLMCGWGTTLPYRRKCVSLRGPPRLSVRVTVTVWVPAGGGGEVQGVRVELPDPPPIAPGLKLALAPAGRPLADRFTVSLKP